MCVCAHTFLKVSYAAPLPSPLILSTFPSLPRVPPLFNPPLCHSCSLAHPTRLLIPSPSSPLPLFSPPSLPQVLPQSASSSEVPRCFIYSPLPLALSTSVWCPSSPHPLPPTSPAHPLTRSPTLSTIARSSPALPISHVSLTSGT